MKDIMASSRRNLIGKRARFAYFLLVLGFFALVLAGFGPNRLARISLATAAPQTTAPDEVWQDIDETSIGNTAQRQIIPSRYRTVRLNKEALNLILAKAPLEFAGAGSISPAEMAFPMPDGSLARFSVVESPIMEPELARQFPEIKTYRGQNIDDPSSMMRFDWTSQGLHAIVLSASGTVYLDPYAKGITDYYISYNKEDYQSDKPFQCLVSEKDAKPIESNSEVSVNGISNGGVLRIYRLAVAATGEYTTDLGGVSNALSTITTNINRVNAIYERDLSVRFILIGAEASIIFPNAGSDPYTNSNPFAMLVENQTTLDDDTIVGSGSYDIGHVFGTGGFGVGAYNAVCSGIKAHGVSSHFSPEDSFAVDMVSHEIGHQFGARHTLTGRWVVVPT